MSQLYLPNLLCAAMSLTLVACQAPFMTATTPSTALSPAPTTNTTPIPTPWPFDELAQQFEYDSATSLNIQDLGEPDLERLRITLPKGVTLSEISYDAPGGVVKGYLVEPPGDGPFAGVLWVHKYPGVNTEFLPEAVSLASRGVVSLLVEGRYPWQSQEGTFEDDRAHIINQILDLRRGLDLLLARDDIDGNRLAYVGHDFGAMHGAVLAGVDKRVNTYVLMTPTGSYYDWRAYFGPLSIDELREYIRLSPTIDPLTYVSHAAPSQLFFQFSQKDGFVPLERAEALFAAGSEPKQMKMYDASHELDEAARADRERFLVDVLSLRDQ